MFIHDADVMQEFSRKIVSIRWILMDFVAVFNIFNDQYCQYSKTSFSHHTILKEH